MNGWRHVPDREISPWANSVTGTIRCVADGDPWPCDAEILRLRAEKAERPLHSIREMQERCDGHCAADECVCPEGGWYAEADRWKDRTEKAEAALRRLQGPTRERKRERIDWSNVVVDEGDEAP